MSKFAFLKNKVLLAITIFTVIAAAGYAQVDRDELKDLPPVVFINYEGPHAVLDTWEEIRQIGVGLGGTISTQERGLAPTLEAMSAEQRRTYSYKFESGAQNRYFVIHSVSGPEGNKMDADIIGLGVDTGVDHIRNLRLIIRGYLQSAYDYSGTDAALLAEYITVYNAVYRGNWDYFTDRYKTPVISNLTREKAGLSIRYDEWPGRTLIVIPLGRGGISAIDTSIITDGRVIEEMRREDDQSVPQRQDMVGLIEREASEAERRAQNQRDSIRQDERQVAEDRRQNEQERQQIAQDRQQLQENRDAGRISDEDARQAENDLDRREDAVTQKDEELDGREEDLNQRRDEAQRNQDFADQKTEEAQQQRQDIARDQQAALSQNTTGTVIGIAIEKSGLPTGRLVRLDSSGNEAKRSPLDTVHVRTVTFIGGKILAIAGENVGRGAVRIIEINQDSLEMTKQGEDDIRPGSLLWVNGNDLYAITAENNNFYLGRFDTNLTLRAKSTVRVHPEASVVIQQGRLLTQRDNGTVLILNPADLTEAK